MKKIFKIAFGLGLTTGIGGIVGLIWQAQIASVSWPLAAFFITLATLGTMAIVGATIAHNWSRVEQSEMPPSGGKEQKTEDLIKQKLLPNIIHQDDFCTEIEFDYSHLFRSNDIMASLGIKLDSSESSLKITDKNGKFDIRHFIINEKIPSYAQIESLTVVSPTGEDEKSLPTIVQILNLAIACPENDDEVFKLLYFLEGNKTNPNKKELVTKLIKSYSPAEDRPQPRTQ